MKVSAGREGMNLWAILEMKTMNAKVASLHHHQAGQSPWAPHLPTFDSILGLHSAKCR